MTPQRSRIADALERIATALESKPSVTQLSGVGPKAPVFVTGLSIARCPECNTLGTAHSPNCPNRSR